MKYQQGSALARHAVVTVGAAVVAIIAAGCSSDEEIVRSDYPSDTVPVGTLTANAQTASQGSSSVFGGDGMVLGPSPTAPIAGMGVNGYLWRASLDTVSFLPLASADPFGGVIITDWYSPPEVQNERFKVNVYILDHTLRSDGVRVSVFRQGYSGGEWIDVPVSDDLTRDLENAILARARELRLQNVAVQ